MCCKPALQSKVIVYAKLRLPGATSGGEHRTDALPFRERHSSMTARDTLKPKWPRAVVHDVVKVALNYKYRRKFWVDRALSWVGNIAAHTGWNAGVAAMKLQASAVNQLCFSIKNCKPMGSPDTQDYAYT